MPSLNEQRIVKKFNIFPFNYEDGRVGWFETYYLVEEWCKPGKFCSWGWWPVSITTKEVYERFKKSGEIVRIRNYSRL